MTRRVQQAQTELRRRLKAEEDDARSAEASARYAAIRLREEYERRQTRSQTPLGSRVARALSLASRLSETSAEAPERISTGKAESAPPPPAEGLLFGRASGSVFDVYAYRIRILVTALEREVDSHLFRSLDGVVSETTEEKERRLIQDYQGMEPSLVAFLDPTMGRPEWIERVRVKHGRVPRTGKQDVSKVRDREATD